MVVGHCNLNGLRVVAALADGQGVGSALDGTMKVANSMGGYCRVVGVMVLHRYSGTNDRLVSFSVVHKTMNAFSTLLDECKHGSMVVVPIGRHGGCIRLLGGGALNGDFTTFAVGIFVILAAARYHIPLGTIGDTTGIRIGHVG